MVRGAIAELLGPTVPMVNALNRKELGPRVVDLYRKTKVILAAVGQFHDWLRVEVEANGPVESGDGTALSLVESVRDVIDPLAGWTILAERLSPVELAACLTVGKTRLLEAIGEKAPPHGKGKARMELMAALEAAGAINHKTIKSMRECRVDEPKPKEIES
jgi:hypothetical protein